MRTITKDVIGIGGAEYEEFIADNLVPQLAGFRESGEPPHEFARRIIGQLSAFVDGVIKTKKMKLT